MQSDEFAEGHLSPGCRGIGSLQHNAERHKFDPGNQGDCRIGL